MSDETPEIPQGYRQSEVGVIPEDWGVGDLGPARLEADDGRGGPPSTPGGGSKGIRCG